MTAHVHGASASTSSASPEALPGAASATADATSQGRPPKVGEGRPRRTVDLDPSGQVTQKEPDRLRRQFLNYAFFKLDPAFRRLPEAQKEAARREFLETVSAWETDADLKILRTYSLIGMRAEVDFMLWRIAFDVRAFAESQAAINRTALAGWLTQPYNFVAMQKRSQYVNRIEGSGHGVELLPGQGLYLFVYPFIKTRAWYDLTPHARQGMMDEHIHASEPFKGIRINTSYSYGIDDQEFVVSFDSDYPQEFVDLVHRLRYTEASNFTLRDTPMFTCVKRSLEQILHDLG